MRFFALGWPTGTRRDLGCYLYHSEKILAKAQGQTQRPKSAAGRSGELYGSLSVLSESHPPQRQTNTYIVYFYLTESLLLLALLLAVILNHTKFGHLQQGPMWEKLRPQSIPQSIS